MFGKRMKFRCVWDCVRERAENVPFDLTEMFGMWVVGLKSLNVLNIK